MAHTYIYIYIGIYIYIYMQGMAINGGLFFVACWRLHWGAVSRKMNKMYPEKGTYTK
jgi:hypothetical protein